MPSSLLSAAAVAGVAVILVFLLLSRRRSKGELTDTLEAQEAARLGKRAGVSHGVRVAEPVRMSGPEFLKLMEEEAKAGAESDPNGIHLTITIPASLMPVERGERFEDPLDDALGDLGQVEGGGSLLHEVEGEKVIVSCDIEVFVKDLGKALPIIRKTLKSRGAPSGTTIIQYQPEEKTHPLDE